MGPGPARASTAPALARWRRAALTRGRLPERAPQCYGGLPTRWAGTSAHPPLDEVFGQLRGLRPPCDAAQLAALTAAAVARREELDARSTALLVHRFGSLDWHSADLCEALGAQATTAVEELSPPEWLTVLRYFTGVGYHHVELCHAASRWALERVRQLQLHHLEVLVTSLAHFRHIDGLLGDRIADVVDPVPPGADGATLLQLAAALAVVGVDRTRFFQQVLGHLSVSGASLGPFLDAGPIRRAHLLLLFAKSGTSQPRLVLNLVRGISPEAVRAAVPLSLLAPLVRQLHRAALQQEALLLDARPLMRELALAAAELAAANRSTPSELAPLASGIAFFGVEVPRAADALWQAALTADASEAWRRVTASDEPGPVRSFAQLAWASCVLAGTSEDAHRRRHGPKAEELTALLRAGAPEMPGLQRVTQQLRQLALTLQQDEGPRMHESRAAAEPWLQRIPRAMFFSQRRRVQARFVRALRERLQERGASVEVYRDEALQSMPSDSLNAAKNVVDTLLVTPHLGAQARVSMWVKHPLLLDASAEDPESAVGGAAERNCCLNGFEAIERQCGPPAAATRLLLARADLDREGLEAMADELLTTLAPQAA